MHRLRAFIFRLIGFTALAIMISAYCPDTVWSSSTKDHLKRHSFQLQSNDDDPINSNGLLAGNKKRSYNRNFENLSPREQESIEERYREWQKLSPQEKEVIRQRMHQWQKMPPGEQRLYQRRFQQWQHLSPEERRNLQEKLNRWNQLSPQEQESIRRRFNN
jgi:hypothetical protein